MEAKFEAECAKRAAEYAKMEVQFQRLRQTMCEEFLSILANQSQVHLSNINFWWVVLLMVVVDNIYIYIYGYVVSYSFF